MAPPHFPRTPDCLLKLQNLEHLVYMPVGVEKRQEGWKKWGLAGRGERNCLVAQEGEG